MSQPSKIPGMPTVLQLTHILHTRPEVSACSGVDLRHYAGPQDIEPWLRLRTLAFARQKVGVRQWTAADFQAEMLDKPWWRPECMWLAEEMVFRGGAKTLVGTVTLAWRGEPPAGNPAVHWLAVLPGNRRRGVARMLLAALEAAVWDAGHRQIWLETHAGWSEANDFYRAHGYEPIG